MNNSIKLTEIQLLTDKINNISNELYSSIIEHVRTCWQGREGQLYLYRLEDLYDELKSIVKRLDELKEYVQDYHGI